MLREKRDCSHIIIIYEQHLKSLLDTYRSIDNSHIQHVMLMQILRVYKLIEKYKALQNGDKF